MSASLLVVDAANVVGARPDGWWKDRAGAAARLLTALDAAVGQGVAAELDERRVVVVLEGRATEAACPAGPTGRLEVVPAERDGDATIVELVAERSADDVLVVTSDRELRHRVEALGARVRGSGWLRDLLDAANGSPQG